ncbi:MATH domain and coiled-coil domain-containing protein At3g58210-like [Prosopis cineraria]|uniref:MATH domain and coiled-coil domain-containing protein At3g58210-like n=1 Tax=Prosopis cineraria TaxID=364024 RepID=UPI0024102653|nr:MATH domain and coiled-coil domain-containing protein At3g58210-like [Prosopis cineraria]
MDLHSFGDPSNGYLIEDTCIFGAEILVIKPPSRAEFLTMIDEPVPLSYRWKFNNFSRATLEKYESEFLAGDYKWKLVFYPNGQDEGKGNSISLFLHVDTSSVPPNTKLYVHYILRIKDQIKGQDVETKLCKRYFSSSNPSWGSRTLVPLAKLKDPTKGFLEGNSCIFKTEFKVLGLVNSL